MRRAVALAILVAVQLAGSAPALATVIIFHDYTYDHLAWPPHAAERCRESGVTTLAMKIDRHGLVSKAQVITSSGFADLDVAAQQAAMGWRYRTGGAKPFSRKAQVVFSVGDHAPPREGECTTAAVQTRAAAMVRAPLVNGIRMPKGLSAPKLLGNGETNVDLGAGRAGTCEQDTTTHEYVVSIGADGSVYSVEPDDPWGVPVLDQAAMHFVESLHYVPARSKRTRVPVSIYVFVTPRPLDATRCVLRVE